MNRRIVAIVLLVVLGIIGSGAMLIQGALQTGPSSPTTPSITYYSNVNFTESGINFTAYPSITWGGYIFQQALSTIPFSTSKTYQNISVGSDFPTTATFTMNMIGPISGNVYYVPSPSTGIFGSFSSVGNTLFVHVTYTKETGYWLNVTEYSLPAFYNFTGMITNDLNPGNVTHYFGTTANYFSMILGNGTWFLYPNGTTDGIQTFAPAHSPIMFAISGANYSLTVQFIDTTPGQKFLAHFTERGLPSGTNWSFIVNGTTYSQDNLTNNVTLPAGKYSLTGYATGYSYNGSAMVYVESPGVTIYVNFTSSSGNGTTSQLNGLLGNVNLSLGDVYTIASMMGGLFIGLWFFVRTQNLIIAGMPLVVIPVVAYLMGLISIWVPVMMVFAYAGMIALDVWLGQREHGMIE